MNWRFFRILFLLFSFVSGFFHEIPGDFTHQPTFKFLFIMFSIGFVMVTVFLTFASLSDDYTVDISDLDSNPIFTENKVDFFNFASMSFFLLSLGMAIDGMLRKPQNYSFSVLMPWAVGMWLAARLHIYINRKDI